MFDYPNAIDLDGAGWEVASLLRQYIHILGLILRLKDHKNNQLVVYGAIPFTNFIWRRGAIYSARADSDNTKLL